MCVLIYTDDTEPVPRDMYLEKNRVPYKTSLDMYSHKGIASTIPAQHKM